MQQEHLGLQRAVVQPLDVLQERRGPLDALGVPARVHAGPGLGQLAPRVVHAGAERIRRLRPGEERGRDLAPREPIERGQQLLRVLHRLRVRLLQHAR